MKNNSIFLSLLLLVTVMYLASGCGKCKDCRNKDCEGYTIKPNAGFKAYLCFDNGRCFEVQDSLYAGIEYVFRSNSKEMDSHRWSILSAIPQNDIKDSFVFELGPSFNNRRIEVQQIVTKTDDRACYPDKQGRDTARSSFYVSPYLNENFVFNWNSALLGQWRGTCDCFPDIQYTMVIKDTFDQDGGSYWGSVQNAFPNAVPVFASMNSDNYVAGFGNSWPSTSVVLRTPFEGMMYINKRNRDSITTEFKKYEGTVFPDPPTRRCKFKGARIR